jgi:hypothetical protein
MLGSLTTPGWFAARDDAAPQVAFLYGNSVGAGVGFFRVSGAMSLARSSS